MVALRIVRICTGMALVATCACTARKSLAGPADTLAAAELALRQGELSRALALADSGLALVPSGANAEWSWKFRLLRSDVLLERGDTQSALEQLSGAPPDGTPYQALRGKQEYLFAKAQRDQGHLQEALATLDRARRIIPEDHELQRSVDWLAGQIHLRMGRWQEGEALLNLVATRAASVGDRYQQALAFLDLGMSRLVRGRYDEALTWLERVLAFSDLDRTTVSVKALNNVGICYSRLGLFERAVQIQRRAVDIQQARGPSKPLDEALGSLGVTHGLSGDLRGALQYLQQAMEVATQIRNTSDAALWAGDLASADARPGGWDN